MATYYLVGSGNWSNPAIWSLTDNGPGGAGVPSTGDDVRTAGFNGPKNLTLTMDQNVTVNRIYSSFQYTGTLNFGNFTHTFGSLQIDGGNTNLQGSDITVTTDFARGQAGASVYNFNPGSSVVRMLSGQLSGISGSIANFATVIIESQISTSSVSANNVSIDALIIRRTTSGVNLLISNGGTIYVRRLISYGSSRPSITNFINNATVSNIDFGTSSQIIALQNTNLRGIAALGAGSYYAEASSLNSGNNSNISFTDAPRVIGLVDSFPGSTLDSTKWTTSSSSGGYAIVTSNRLDIGGVNSSSQVSVISKNQYILEGSSVTFKLSRVLGSSGYGQIDIANAYQQYGVSARRNIPNISVTFDQTSIGLSIQGASSYNNTYSIATDTFIRVRESAGRIYLDTSDDGIAFTNRFMPLLSTYGIDSSQITARPSFIYLNNNSGYYSVSQFNVPQEPTAEFTYSAVSGNTPLTVNFTDQSNFNPTNWSWNFGDTTTSTSQNPSKTYSAPGTYSVSLTSSNSSYTRSITKTNLVNVIPNVYSRSISGTLIFGGSLARKILASRSISGGLVFGGSVRAVVLRDVEGLQDKRYLYKVYEPDGTYIEVWKDVISEPTYTNEINTIGSTTYIELARNSDTVGTSISPLQTEAGTNLLTENDFDILVGTESRNQVGSGSSVDYNNRVDIIVFYGSVEPLLTEMDEEIWTENDEELLADIGAPNGRRLFTGFISEINSRYGSTETTVVQVTSFGWDLDQYPITTSGGDTTVPFLSVEPSSIARTAVDKFVTDSSAFGTYTERTDSSIANSGTVVSYTFKVNTYKEVLDKTLELLPSNWYYRIGLGDNVVYYDERSTTPKHLFYLGKHIKSLDLRGSILDSTNRVLFTGGGDPALYIDRSELPADRTRRTLEVMSDSRVTVLDSAEVISEGAIEQNNKRLFRTSIEILSKQYDIESIDVGDTVGFRNFGNEVDGFIMQIVGLSYSPDTVQLQLETKPPTISKRLEDIRRNMTVSDNQFVPPSPS